MDLKKSLIIAIALSLVALAAWEMYWRATGKVPDLDDDKYLWAVQRAKLPEMGKQDVVIVGSSRVLFNLQLDVWEATTGRKPLQLASAGSSPLPIFRDLVENTNFAGTVIVGVTPGLFFSTTFPGAMPWARAQKRVDHFHRQTYAQRLNYALSIPIQRAFCFVSDSEEKFANDVDLRAMLARASFGNRTGGPVAPPFNGFHDIDLDRNVRMTERCATDTAFAATVQRVWGFFGSVAPPPDKESTIAFFLQDAKRFMERGGNLILVRCPSTGPYRAGEAMVTPRAEYWDALVQQTGARAYHFEDYEQLKRFDCPEWSHLSGPDADLFTAELLRIMAADQALPLTKN